MTERTPYEKRRYSVCSRENTSGVPAGRYDEFDEAIAHSETVTYEMHVLDEVRGEVVYRNYETGDSNA